VLRSSEVANTQLSPALAHSIALAPALEELHIPYDNVAPAFFQHLGERCKSADGGPPVTLRRLHIQSGRAVSLESGVLSLLPQLEQFDCPIHYSFIPSLADCPSLRSLTIGCGWWTDASYRQLAELRLSHLEELELTDFYNADTVAGGLGHLLQLPALTLLRLPSVAADSLLLLRLLAQSAGRRTLRIEDPETRYRYAPSPTFPLFDQ